MGNFDTKHSPYYAISDESTTEEVTNVLRNSKDPTGTHTLWTIKRANYDGKNGTLFEFNNHKATQSNKQLGFALNQIRTLKKIRHPNLVKYFYSEEPFKSQVPIPQSHPSFKCVLITEFVRPITTLIESLTGEQISHGIYGITNAIQFLHEKTQTSHNNLSESCIYVNCKQVWKLNDFELALGFSHLTKDNLREIYELKQKNAITPEEEINFKEPNQTKLDLNKLYQEAPHSIDAYGWAITILNLLSNSSKKKSFKAFFGDENTNTNSEHTSAEQLELYLSTNPTERPTLKNALDINLFSSYKTNVDENSVENQLFKIDNLEDLEKNFTVLLNYCANLTAEQVNEKLIDFLLTPFMFFSERMRKELFPLLFIPKELYVGEEQFQTKIDFTNFYFSVYQNYITGKCMRNEMTMGISIEPFMDLNKYRTFVIPRILNLLTMHSTQIRLVLLEYFPFYIGHINDNQSLHYEILPELLVGLKDTNDELVSLTLSCLSIIVKVLGSEIVIGRRTTKENRQSIFSNNLPKSISVDFKESILNESTNSLKTPNEATPKVSKFHKNKSADFGSDKFKENIAFNLNNTERTKFSSVTSLDQEMITMNGPTKNPNQKLISDSMIALHDETEEASDAVSVTSSMMNKKVPYEVESKSAYLDFNGKINGDDGWSNDWNDNWEEDKSDQNGFRGDQSLTSHHQEGSASLFSLAGSVDLLVPQEEKIIKSFTPSKKLADPLKKLKVATTPSKKSNGIQDIGSEYDIKSIVIKKKEEPNVIDDFFNDMQPVIAKKQTNLITNGYGRLMNEKENAVPHSPAITETSKKLLVESLMPSENSEVSWECEDIELDEV